MNPEQDFYCDINLHLNTIKEFVLEHNATGFIAGQPWWDTTEGRIVVHNGTTPQKVMLFELDVLDEDDMISNSDIKVPTQQSVKAYVDALENELASTANGEGASKVGIEDVGGYYTNTNVEGALQEIGSALGTLAGGIDLQGDIDASTNPNYPAALTGHAYYVIAAGKVGGVSGKVVNIGDLVIAKADNAGGDEATVGTSWFVLESNRDQATETVLGVAKIATQVITDAGVNDTDIVTPLKLKNRLSSIGTLVQEKSALLTTTTTPVLAVSVGAGGSFSVGGNVTTHLEAGCIIEVSGSSNNDGLYTVASAVFGGINTVITVNEVVAAIADGNVIFGLKNTITLTNIDLNGNDAHHQVHETTKRQEVFPYVYYSGTTDVVVWFRSPASGSHEVIVQGLYANW